MKISDKDLEVHRAVTLARSIQPEWLEENQETADATLDRINADDESRANGSDR